MNRLTKYLYVGLTSVRSNLAYVAEVAMRVVFLGVILFIFLQLWRLTYAEAGEERLGGLTLAQMLWYLAITESIVLSAPPVAPAIDEDVRTGALAVHLLRPLSYPLYRMWAALGERAVRFALNASAGAVVALAFVGPIPMSWLGAAAFLATIPLAFVTDFLAHLLVGLAAFWLENTSGLLLLYTRFAMILGGMMIPLDLFPEGLRRVAVMLPFAGIVYGPARMFVDPSPAALPRVLATQAAGIVVFGLVAAFVYARAVRRIHANGG